MRFRKKCLLFLIAAVTSLILLELICRYVIDPSLDRKIFTLMEQIYEDELTEDFLDKLGDPTDLNHGAPKFPHPYFGYTRPLTNQNKSLESDTYGFVERPELWQLRKTKDTLTIGIFGASVAAKAYLYDKKHQVLTKTLRKLLPLLANRKIQILNFAYSGYKQPQQFIISSFFMDKLDITINIEGANELSTAHPKDFPLTHPKRMISSLYFSSDVYSQKKAQAEIFSTFLKASNLKKLFTNNEYYFSLIPTFYKSLFLFLWKKMLNELTILSRPGHLSWQIDEQVDFPKMKATLWSKFVEQQYFLSKKYNVLSLFVLQPVPYATKKRLSRNELEIVSKIPMENKRSLIRSFETFANEVKVLQLKGVNIINSEDLFKDSSEEVFVDDCCHLNSLGNTLFLEFLGEKIAHEMEKNSRR